MWQALVQATGRLVKEVSWGLRRGKPPEAEGFETPATHQAKVLEPISRLQLTSEVSQTLFDEFADHRRGTRGEEETGWILLGVRDGNAAVALATLPAGARREAGVAHVRFNVDAQAMGSRIVRQLDRRLTMLGVVHTHPGSLRHPSDADFRADSEWVAQLRGKEGVFGIGTADGKPASSTVLGVNPKPNVQCLGKLCFSWYGLQAGAGQYRPLPVGLVLGPDLARPLHAVWETIEAHATRLDRLARQQTGLTFDVASGSVGPALAMTVPLAEPGDSLRVLMEGKQVSYFLQRGDDLVVADAPKARVDQGVYLLLAELASQH